MHGETLVRHMLDAALYPHDTRDIHMLETHCAWVILTGDFAYKIKKPVNFGFLDFSTLEKRRHFCEEELRLNRRFAPQIYLRVVTINGSPECPELSGDGEVLEYAVCMRQFPSGQLLSELAETGGLTPGHVDQLVQCIADFHDTAACASDDDEFGTPGGIHHWAKENYQHILPLLHADDDSRRVERLRRWTEEEYNRLNAIFASRKAGGSIRECHGDLHLGNITLINGRVTPFDCIEFNPQLRWIDVISEVAFLLMDLDDRGQSAFFWRFLNGYLQHGGDYDGLRVLRYYLVYRAMVRAKVAILRRHQIEEDEDAQALATREYLQYLELAERYAAGGAVSLVITHGLSGSGKSTVAAILNQRIGFVQLRSDIERKRLAGLSASARSGSQTGSGIYTGDQTRMTYERLETLATVVLQAGFSVIVDATFLLREQRTRFKTLSERLSVPFLILDCVAEAGLLEQRIASRASQGRDASEATLDVLRLQQQQAEKLEEDELGCALRIDTGTMDDVAIEAAVRSVQH